MTPYPTHTLPSPQRPRASRGRVRSGFSYVEVMISVSILATALITMVGTIYSLNAAHQGEREDALVQQIANTMVERVMGANFATLGQAILPTVTADQNAWSWQRRATLLPNNVAIEFGQTDSSGVVLSQPLNPPLMENVPAGPNQATSDLVLLGLEQAPSNLNGLRVYVEYYNMNILLNQQALTQQTLSNPSLQPYTVWYAAVGNPTLTNPTTSPPTFNAGSTASFVPIAVSPAVTLAPPFNCFEPEYSGITPITASAAGSNPAVNPVQINVVAVTNSALTDVQAAMTQNSAILVRILVYWIPWKGGGRWHEISVIRRGDS